MFGFKNFLSSWVTSQEEVERQRQEHQKKLVTRAPRETTVKLPVYVFEDGKWIEMPQHLDDQHPAFYKMNFKVLTYNIWFDVYYEVERWKGLVSLIDLHQPHVACFQEVTHPFLKWLVDQPTIRANYVLSDVTGVTLGPYGVMALVHKTVPVTSLTLHELESFMDRKFLLVEVMVMDRRGLVGTVHLESLNTARTRKQQLRDISRVLPASDDVSFSCLTGDFNFDSEKRFHLDDPLSPLENLSLPEFFPLFSDVWPTLNPLVGDEEDDSRGYTFDTKKNPMMGNHRPERMRYDRILFFSPKTEKISPPQPRWHPINIQILGDQPMEGGPKDIVPSDHFGLLATFEYQNTSTSPVTTTTTTTTTTTSTTTTTVTTAETITAPH